MNWLCSIGGLETFISKVVGGLCQRAGWKLFRFQSVTLKMIYALLRGVSILKLITAGGGGT